MAKTTSYGATGKSTARRTTGKSRARSAISGRFVSERFVSGSSARGTRVQPASDTDLVGSVRLTTPQQVARFGKLKQRVDAELQNRGMRDSA